MKDFARSFYNSGRWKEAQSAYMASRCYVCERCGSAARIVHHIRYLTPQNINDPEVALSWDNLEALCQDCHNHEHLGESLSMVGVAFDGNGQIIKKANVFLVCGGSLERKREWIRKHKGKNDFVLDMDEIRKALQHEGEGVRAIAESIEAVVHQAIQSRRGSWSKAFVISNLEDAALQRAAADSLSADLIQLAG